MELPKKNCLNCQSFAWWDGDYCCVEKFKILQESKKGEFNDQILTSIEENKDCKKWKKANDKIREMHMEAFNNFLKNRN